GGEWEASAGGLAGAGVIVLAGIPQVERTLDQLTSPVLEAEEAVVSVVRALLIEGCAVTVVGASSLALLATVVAGEYAEPRLDDRARRPSLLSVHLVDQSTSASAIP